jgi:polyhydroxybutyrate depolymerase
MVELLIIPVRHFMKKFLVILSALMIFVTAAQAEEQRTAGGGMNKLGTILRAASKNHEEESKIDNSQKSPEYDFAGRPYILHLPPNFDPKKTYPLVIALHGGGGHAAHLERHLGMDPVADQHGYIVAYLSGVPGKRRIVQNMRTWNGGGCCGYAVESNADDVGYIDSFIKFIEGKYPIDTKRLYMTGHSNGGIMTYRYVCERPGVIAAAASISGPIMIDHCTAPGLRMLHVHGSDDDNVLVQGGYGANSLAQEDFTSVAETEKRLKAAGANMTVKIVQGAPHAVTEISTIMQKTDGISLPEYIAQFFDAK